MGKTLNYEVTLGDLEVAISDRELNDDELLKQKYGILGGEQLRKELEDASKPDVDDEVHIHLKPHGVYIQFDRALVKQKIKDWFFMVRSSVWGGSDISAEQWLELSRLADEYSSDDDGSPSMRLTTRQSIQFHRVRKTNLLKLIQGLIDINRSTLNGCGDNTRNVAACPHKSDIFDTKELAHRIAEYFQLPLEEYLKVFYPGKQIELTEKNKFEYDVRGLPRKFKISIGGYYLDEEKNTEVRCNCADILSNDVGIAPLVTDKKVTGYQVYIGGGLGQKNSKVTFPTLGVPFGVFNSMDELIIGLDAIIKVYQQVGDRHHRHWARLKNILIKKGLEATGWSAEDLVLQKRDVRDVLLNGVGWFREQVYSLGVSFSLPVELQLGELNRHHGWSKQSDGRYSFGLWVQNGRLTDTNPQGKVKSLADKIVKEVKPNVRITPYQDIIFTDIDHSAKIEIEKILADFNYGNYSKLRVLSQACVGLYTCSIAVAESEKYFHPLMTELESYGFTNVEGVTIGISGCERHCSRNVRYDISIEGKGSGIYQIKLLLGSADNNLALDLIHEGKKYLRSVPQNSIPDVIKVLIENYICNRLPEETSMSLYHERFGVPNIIELLKKSFKTSHLMEKTFDATLV